MASARLTTRGRITIPAAVRRAMGVSKGDKIEFVKVGSEEYVLRLITGASQALKKKA